jgi:hypothetical protein
MRKTLIFCGAFLCLSLPAAAQEIATAFDTSSPTSELATVPASAPEAVAAPAPDPAPAAAPTPAPVHFEPSDREEWQVAVGFQYEHFGVFGLSFHDLGYSASVTRYINDWFGLEGNANMGWGHTSTSPQIPRALVANSLFVGGGPHVALSNKTRFEPWGHVLVGLAHFRFTQTNNTLGLGSNSAFGFLAGGGVDVKLGGRAYWRIQGDYVETHYLSKSENNYSFGSGLVFNF